MKEVIKDIRLDEKRVAEEEFIVNGEGCLDDCPTLASWMASGPVTCKKKDSAFLSKKH